MVRNNGKIVYILNLFYITLYIFFLSAVALGIKLTLSHSIVILSTK